MSLTDVLTPDAPAARVGGRSLDVLPADARLSNSAPPLDAVHALYRQGFETSFGDRWTEAYDRFVEIARHDGPLAAAQAVRQPGGLLDGVTPPSTAASLSQALASEARRLGEDPLRVADARIGVQRYGAAPSDARVAIQDGPEVGDGRVSIDATIYIYGSGATREIADLYERGIRQEWGQQPDGSPWTYTSPSGETYEVQFNVDVALYDPENPARAPGLFSGRLHPANRDNFIRVEPVDRSRVWLGENGMWRSEGRDGRSLAEDNPAAHEFGHLLGLRDRYTRRGARDGWEGNVMAESAGVGAVEQRDIDRIVAKHVERFEKADLPDGQIHHSSIAPWF